MDEFDAEPTAGDLLAKKYRLMKRLGQGGMATVWLAENTALEARVAVKVLRGVYAKDPRVIERMRREAKATASLSHRNVVHVFDFGVTSGGYPFIVMELLRGETFASAIEARKRLSSLEAAAVVLRAMRGVAVAHTKGIYHRDLKPENIFLALDENDVPQPKVLDFGVSFMERPGDDNETGVTKQGSMVGTPSYLPPEAILKGKATRDALADIWALGIILHEAVSGKVPFAAPTYADLLRQIVSAKAPRLEGVDPYFQSIVDRALEKDPKKRYPDVKTFFEDLNGWMADQRAGAPISRAAVALAAPLPNDPANDEEGPTQVWPMRAGGGGGGGGAGAGGGGARDTVPPPSGLGAGKASSRAADTSPSNLAPRPAASSSRAALWATIIALAIALAGAVAALGLGYGGFR
jgi:eukaryotic-like serine/threonine-protein kinase